MDWQRRSEMIFMRRMERRCRGLATVVLGVCLVNGGLAAAARAQSQAEMRVGAATPETRFASLKSDRVQLHQGPGAEFPIAWVFRRAGLPVEVLGESAAWSQVRDAEGTTGWVWSTALSKRRTALVGPPGAQGAPVPMRDDDDGRAEVLAQVEPGVLAAIISCSGRWCRISVGGFRGYVEQAKLWGTREGELIK